MKPAQSRAFTLLEALVVCVIFLVIVWLAVAALQFGINACQLVSLRADLQSAATRVMLNLQNDLRRSHVDSVSMAHRSATFAGQNYQRDALSMAGISNWADTSSLNSQFGVPNFNRYILYYATNDAAGGRLIRTVVDNTQPGPPNPIPSFDDIKQFNNDPAKNGSDQLAYTHLSDSVSDFSVGDGVATQSVRASLRLFRQGLRGPTEGAKNTDQAFQMVIELVPQNTSPRY